MEASDFIRKERVSCNGCFFQQQHRVTCMDDINEKLINEIFFRLGKCFDGHNTSIFLLKGNTIDSNRFKRAKPKKQKSFIEEIDISKTHIYYDEREHLGERI
jgi:hypothetical protein